VPIPARKRAGKSPEDTSPLPGATRKGVEAMIPRTSSRSLLLSAIFTSIVAFCGPMQIQAAELQESLSRTASELPPLKYIEVADSVVMLQNEKPYGSNMICFAVDDGLLFVDAGFFTEIAYRFRKDMEVKFRKKTIALLLSHAHMDHFFGMGAFADVPVVAAAAGKDRFREQLSIDFESRVDYYKRFYSKFDEALETARPFMPTIWVETEIEFGSGDKPVRFRSTGGHTACSSYAYSPTERVIATGDNLQVDSYPYFGDPTGDMEAWINTLEQWEISGESTFCPGHGRPVDLLYLASTRVYFRDLVSALTKLTAEGVPVEEALTHPSLPAGYWGSDASEPPWYRPTIAGLYRSILP
jgi:glyoxylase-like metal-dependent hydrolase (beta-lactamase superfamily II)